MKPERRFAWAGFVLLLIALVPLAYFTHRSQSTQLLALFTLAFAGYLLLGLRSPSIEWRRLLALAIALRLLLLFAPISWTDDHFRYLWDGWCSVHGIQPFAHTPREVLHLWPDLFSATHFASLNSPDFHTVYPPLAQGFFAVAAFFGQGDTPLSALVLRALFIACEVATLVLLHALLRDRANAQRWWMLYAFNPLVLMELSVNLHTEALMIPLCLGTLLMHQRGRLDASAVLLGLAVATRLWPLLFVLALPAVLTWRKGLRYGSIVALVSGIGWLPLWTPDLPHNLGSSLKLFGTHLEFNGGLFELLRVTLGPDAVKGSGLLALITATALLLFAAWHWRKRSLSFADLMLWLLFIHFLGSQAVHPWYILPLLALGVLSGRWWPIAWSLLIVPTYLTYGSEPYTQPYGWIAVEYGVLGAWVVLEENIRRRSAQHSGKPFLAIPAGQSAK